MKSRGGERSSLAGTIADFLRARGLPASSAMLSERFLRMPVVSEELATRLLAELLEPAGMAYEPERGWSAPRAEMRAPVAASFAGAAVDRTTGEVVLAGPDGVEPSDPGGATVVMLDPARDATAVRVWLRQRGLPAPAAFVALSRAVRGVVRVRRGAPPDEICAALGVRWLDSEDAAGAARAMAACAVAAARRREETAVGGGAVTPPLPAGIRPETLATLPEAPGVYRFYDETGVLIYVGKAANLKRRVLSYFTASAARRPRRFYPRIHRLEYETQGSELEALLKEARQIGREAPAGNVQVSVRERQGSYLASRSFALLLPRAGGRGVTAVVVRDGVCLGQAAIGPRGGGLAAARRLVSRALRGGGPPRRGPREERDSAILRSWLQRHGELASRIELDGFRTVAEAARALRDAAAQIAAEPGPVVFRRRPAT